MTPRKDQPPHAPLSPGVLPGIVRIVLLYALFASLWILFSDRAVGLLFTAPDTLQAANTLKGLLFVAVTSVLLFFLVLRFAARQNGNGAAREKLGAGGTPPPSRRALLLGVALFSCVFILLGGSATLQNAQRHRQLASEHLTAIARLKATQIENWLDERFSDVRLASGSPVFNEPLAHAPAGGSPAIRARILKRLEEFRTAYHYWNVLLCDPQGEVLLGTGSATHGTSPPLRDTVRRALASGQAQMSDLFLMAEPAPPHAHLDFAAPLAAHPAQAAIVLRADVGSSIDAILRSWPLSSDTAETILFRRDGDAVLPLTELRHAPQAALTQRLPLTQGGMLSVQALAPGYRPGTLLEGVDYRGTPTLGVAYPIGGTTWWLIAKIDRSEVFREADTDALWILFASFLTWLVALVLAVLFYKQRELQHAVRQHSEQAERLRAMQLLEAIANGSTDAIFAKDTQGRYLLFNNEAARVTGKTTKDVLGRDDRVLFPPEQAALIMANDRQVMAEGKTVTFQERLDTADGAVVFLATKGPLRDADGQCIGLFGISRDITQLKQVETALHSQTEELQARNAELERFNRAMVDRELDMIALKRLINTLSQELGRAPPYDLGAFETGGGGGKP